jgi:hypothetical protein
LSFISFRIHHSFSVTSASLGFRLFYSTANKLNLASKKCHGLALAARSGEASKMNAHHVP